jgi:hypothetical protein
LILFDLLFLQRYKKIIEVVEVVEVVEVAVVAVEPFSFEKEHLFLLLQCQQQLETYLPAEQQADS